MSTPWSSLHVLGGQAALRGIGKVKPPELEIEEPDTLVGAVGADGAGAAARAAMRCSSRARSERAALRAAASRARARSAAIWRLTRARRMRATWLRRARTSVA